MDDIQMRFYVSEALRRRIKVDAASKGITLGKWLAEATYAAEATKRGREQAKAK